jgi:four helix bundle protein
MERRWTRGDGCAENSGSAYGRGMQDFKKLRVWHLAHELSLKVIQALPARVAKEVPGLRRQAIRAATSVAANLAEGCARATRAEFLHFVEIALGSLNELEGHLLLARDAGVLPAGLHPQLQRDIDLVRRMLISLMLTLQRHIAREESSRSTSKTSAD